MTCFRIFITLGIIFSCSNAGIITNANNTSAAVLKSTITPVTAVQATDNSLTQDYTRMLEDAKWFFQRMSAMASMVENYLPNAAPMDKSSKKSLDDNSTRLHLLRGLRHLLVGIKEISLTVQQSFDTSHVRHLQQLKYARFFVQDVVIILKNWFAYLRRTLMDLLRLYNYYTPEVLLGKCLGRYLTTTYPDSALYEYPILLIREVLNAAWTGATRFLPTDSDAIDILSKNHNGTHQAQVVVPLHEEKSENNTNNDVEMPNEIPHHEAIARLAAEDLITASTSRQSRQVSTISSISIEPLLPDEDENNQQSWQKCFQLFTAESVMRQLKLYFLQS